MLIHCQNFIIFGLVVVVCLSFDTLSILLLVVSGVYVAVVEGVDIHGSKFKFSS